MSCIINRMAMTVLGFLLLAAPLCALAQDSAPSPAPSALEGWSIPEEGAGGEDEKVPETVPAQARTGQELMALGEESYGSGDYDRALENFKAALPLLTASADQAKAHERLAYIYAAFGRMDDAYNEFVESLKQDPGLELDPDVVSPKIYEAYKKARDLVVHEGIIVVNCDPAGAEVYLDGTLLGESPVRKEHVPEGEYTLMLKKAGYETSEGRVTVKKDVTLTVEDKLAPARGEVQISSRPVSSAVTLDGREEGFTPLTIKMVSGGSHKLVVKHDYYDNYESDFSMEKAEKKSLDISLKRRTLLIATVGGEEPGEGMSPVLEGAVSGPLTKMEDMRVIVRGIKELENDIVERGLDPASLGFLKTRKVRLELEDSAVLSGIMEKEGAELALALHLAQGEREKTLTVTLYGIGSDMGDVAYLRSGDLDGLGREFIDYLNKWANQEKPGIPSIGARVVDRAGGGAEVISVLPGLPAAQAGMIPGDVIAAAGPLGISEKKDLVSMLRPGEKLEVKFTRRGRRESVTLVPVLAPKETPVDSGDYLYNLALADYGSSGVEAVQPDAPRKTDGLASLNLGNVYFRMGEYEKAVKAYMDADTGTSAGVCTGTALYRLGMAYEKLGRWVDAAGSYRKAMLLYPAATLENADGPYVAPLAKERLMEMFKLGLVKERWWQ